MDFVVGVGFRFFACGFRLIGGGFRGFRLLSGPIKNSHIFEVYILSGMQMDVYNYCFLTESYVLCFLYYYNVPKLYTKIIH